MSFGTRYPTNFFAEIVSEEWYVANMKPKDPPYDKDKVYTRERNGKIDNFSFNPDDSSKNPIIFSQREVINELRGIMRVAKAELGSFSPIIDKGTWGQTICFPK